MSRQVRKGDLVQVIAGADRGKQGRVIAVDPKRGLKPGRKAARTGGIIEQEGYIDASNAMLVDPGSGQPSRVRMREEGGRRRRVFARSGDPVPDPAES
jgi:large subunit ribosomal protein L24